MTVQYCQPWLRPQESQLLIAPPDVARELPPRCRRCSATASTHIHRPGEGKHPLRLVDEAAYRTSRTPDSEIADRILTRPDAITG